MPTCARGIPGAAVGEHWSGARVVAWRAQHHAEVEDTSGHPIPGLYAASEIVGGLYSHNKASGTGVMSGAVFGRIAGRNAAAYARG
jgi:succinate dehydrogenase/fumarate reductase flavoprotein subunit